MAFLLERFDVIKQNYDKTGLYMYHDTVGTTAEDPSSGVKGDLLATITAANFFNAVAETLQVPGALIMITATDGAGLYKVTQVYDSSTGKPAVTVVAAQSAANVGS
jgi:hypothetical protein